MALPLDAINAAAAREKSIRHGHPSTLHLWWARRPLAAARAVIFAQLVNDPGFQQGGGFKYGKNKKEAAEERKRLFGILEELVKWESTTNEEVLEAARAEIRRSWREVCELNKDHPEAIDLFDPDKMPGLHDPFAGGGAIPLEAQRLGLEAYATDLNPVAVLINTAMIEIPPKFAGAPPVHPVARASASLRTWSRTQGLSEDLLHYGAWMREEAERSVGHLYPLIRITRADAVHRPELSGLVDKEFTVIAWLWARTVKSPSPAFAHAEVPLVSSFVLSTREGVEHWLEPVVDGATYHFDVRTGSPPPAAKLGTRAEGRGSAFRCVLSGAPISGDYIKAQGKAGLLGTRLMAIVAQGQRGRIFLPGTSGAEDIARSAIPGWKPDVEFMQQALGFRVGNYGMTRWSDLFTPRQITTLATFSDLIGAVRDRVQADAIVAGLDGGDAGLADGGRGAQAYADAIALYLSFAIDKVADRHTSLAIWDSSPTKLQLANTFRMQALQMSWDFAEGNPFCMSSGTWTPSVEWISRAHAALGFGVEGHVSQANAMSQKTSHRCFVATDPPYYDNIGYADLSDFFYVWLRHSLKSVFPSLFQTVAVPKAEELVATPARHGSKEAAEAFFLAGMSDAMQSLGDQCHPAAPVTIFYAFKQSESKTETGTSSTGWETFLEAVLKAGFQLTGTWPIRTESTDKLKKSQNALASSIVLVCRLRPGHAATISRRAFLRELNAELPIALDEMTKGGGDDNAPLAPVDLSQAIIGPGMAVFSKYVAVLEADGSPMSVKTALQLINRFLAEDDFEHDTQFCLHWFDQHGWGEGAYGEAEVLARAKSTSVSGLASAGVLKSGSGKVRLLRPSEYPSDWNPKNDPRIPIWEALHQLIRALREQGESSAGQLLAVVKAKSEAIRQLAYRLYTLCERRGWADDARAYNELVTSWSAVDSVAGEVPERNEQLKLFGGNE